MKHLRFFAVGFLILLASPVWAARTFYVDYMTGDDTLSEGSAQSKTAPWATAPGMYTKGGVTRGAYNHVPGDRFIFKGGVTWPHACWPFFPSGSGTSWSEGGYDYYGVDETWYTGASWSRPVWDGEYTVINQPKGPPAGRPCMVFLHYHQYIQFDNLEMKRLWVPPVNYSGNTAWSMGSFIYNDSSENIKFTYCYLHDWHLDPAITTRTAQNGGINNSGNYVYFDHGEIHNMAYAGIEQNGVAFSSLYEFSHNVIHDVAQVVVGTVIAHDNIMYNINYPGKLDEYPSKNGIWASGDSSNPVYVYNNLFYNFGGTTTPLYAVMCWGGRDDRQYWFNNVVIASNVMSTGFSDAGANGGESTYCGELYFFNNTLHSPSDNYWMRLESRYGFAVRTAYFTNNHIVNVNGNDNGTWTDIPQNFTKDDAHQIYQSYSDSIGQGYTEGNYAAPAIGSGRTINAGVDITTLDWYSQLPADIKTAIRKDRLGVARGLGANWDIGAYEYAPRNDGTAPAAPRGLVVR